MGDELIVGSGQRRVARTVLRFADHRLQVLDAHADGKFLLFHDKSARKQHLKGVPRAVPDGEHQFVARLLFSVDEDARKSAACYLHIGEHARKAELPAPRLNVAAHICDHRPQVFAPDVGLAEVGDLRRRAVSDKGLEHIPVARVVGLGVELAVRKGARAALAELDVARGIEHARRQKFFHVGGALLHPLAAL